MKGAEHWRVLYLGRDPGISRPPAESYPCGPKRDIPNILLDRAPDSSTSLVGVVGAKGRASYHFNGAQFLALSALYLATKASHSTGINLDGNLLFVTAGLGVSVP